MSDGLDSKKGIRTFAADFARLKAKQADAKTNSDTPSEQTNITADRKIAVPSAEMVRVADHANSEDIKQIVAEKTKNEPTTPASSVKSPKKIPPFHELQREQIAAIKKTEHKPAVIKKIAARNKKAIQPNRQVGGGTVITATKQSSRPERLGLLASLTAWIASWKLKKHQSPQIAIPETSRRKGVIQTATTKTGTIFTADSDTLKERIKERVRQRELATHDPDTSWSPFTETGFPLLEAGDEIITTPTNVSVAFTQHTKPQPEVVTATPDTEESAESPRQYQAEEETEVPDNRWDKPQQLTVPQPEITKPTSPVVPLPSEVTPTITKPTPHEEKIAVSGPGPFARLLRSMFGSHEKHIDTPSDITAPANSTSTPATVTTEKPLEITYPTTEDVRSTQNQTPEPTTDSNISNSVATTSVPHTAVLPKSYNAKQLLQSSSTNRLTVMSTVTIVVVVLIIFTGLQAAVFFGDEQKTGAVTQTLFTANQVVPLTVDNSFTAQTLINAASSGPSGVIEYSLYNSDNEVLHSALVLDLVSDNFPITIQQFGTDTRFISIDQTRPQLLIQISDKTSVTGALLARELALTQALTPLFGVAPTGSYIDNTIGLIDVRTLTSTSGQTSLTYGFINDTTLLITGTPEEFSTVLNRIQ
jgi:hypothetical protein